MTARPDGTRTAGGRVGFAPVIGIVLLSSAIVLVLVGSVLLFGGGNFSRVVWGLPGGAGLWALGFSMAGYPITRRHPANAVGWCLMVAGVAVGVSYLGTAIPKAADPGGLAFWLTSAWVVSVGALCTALVLFPSGSPPSRWWWAYLGVLWGSGSLQYFMEYDAFAGWAGAPGWLGALALPNDILFQLSSAAGCFALLARWRRSGPVERLQLKWVVYSVVLVAVTAPVVEVGLANLLPAWYLAGTVVPQIVILAVPVTIGVAMLRYRLYDIDVVINRTLVYVALSASLVLLYVGGVVGLQYVLRVFAGGGSQLAIVASTLSIAALFNPLRNRFQSFIDRRFYRRKYDSQKTLESFSKRLRDETDLEALNTELMSVVRETVQPEHVSLWLRRPEETGAR
jgi:hypothetical protein